MGIITISQIHGSFADSRVRVLHAQPRSQVSRSQDVSWEAAEHQASQSADQSLDVRAHAGPFLWVPLRGFSFGRLSWRPHLSSAVVGPGIGQSEPPWLT